MGTPAFFRIEFESYEGSILRIENLILLGNELERQPKTWNSRDIDAGN
jgi:hypothetical protein